MRFRSFAFLPEAQQQRGGCSEAQRMNERRGEDCGAEWREDMQFVDHRLRDLGCPSFPNSASYPG